MTLMLFTGAWKKMIHEKSLKQKSFDIVPFHKGPLAKKCGANPFYVAPTWPKMIITQYNIWNIRK
jgi:hypothetical protein